MSTRQAKLNIPNQHNTGNVWNVLYYLPCIITCIFRVAVSTGIPKSLQIFTHRSKSNPGPSQVARFKQILTAVTQSVSPRAEIHTTSSIRFEADVYAARFVSPASPSGEPPTGMLRNPLPSQDGAEQRRVDGQRPLESAQRENASTVGYINLKCQLWQITPSLTRMFLCKCLFCYVLPLSALIWPESTHHSVVRKWSGDGISHARL